MERGLDQLSVNPEHSSTITHQIKQQITWLIASGKLQPGDRLPTVRQLAAQLSVNLHTVRKAYHTLADEGLLEMRPGRGAHALAFDPRNLALRAAAIPSHTVGVILPSFTNPFYHALLQGIADAADQDRTLLFMCLTRDDPTDAWRYYAQLTARQVDGIIAVSTSLEYPVASTPARLDSACLPLVSVDWPGATRPAVNLDLEGAGYQATHHLLALGHRRIGLITYNQDLANVAPVNAGYRRALQNASCPFDPALVAPVSAFDIAAGVEGCRQLLTLPKPPGAIFAITDLLAVGAMQALRAAGLRTPQDIAVVGFNDIPLAALVEPPLTTVAAPAHAMGQAAMHLLQAWIAGKAPTGEPVVFKTRLIVRSSCGAPVKSDL